MITLYDNPFSPFTRKVRLVLAHKGLGYESIDALALEQRERLLDVNPRGEVPVLDDAGFVVVDSSQIVAYLEDRYPDPPLLPQQATARARARAWEKLCDTTLDAVIHDVSLWSWPTHRRRDRAPDGLLEAGVRDLERIVQRIERGLENGGFLCGELSVADLALFPHVTSLKPLGIVFAAATHPRLAAWNRRMRSLEIVRADLDYVRRMATEKFAAGRSPYESEQVVWRGDRIEWLFARGFHAWWLQEFAAGRAVVPSSA